MGLVILLLIIVLLFILWRGWGEKWVIPVVFLLGIAVASAGDGAVAKVSYDVLYLVGAKAIAAVQYLIGGTA